MRNEALRSQPSQNATYQAEEYDLEARARGSHRGVSKGVTKPDLCFRRQSGQIGGCAMGESLKLGRWLGQRGPTFCPYEVLKTP